MNGPYQMGRFEEINLKYFQISKVKDGNLNLRIME